MDKLKRYWLVALLTLVMCLGGKPGLASLSGFLSTPQPNIIRTAPVLGNPAVLGNSAVVLGNPTALGNSAAATSPSIIALATQSSLEQDALEAYRQGQYQRAAELLQQVQVQYSGDKIRVAIALSNLSLTQQHLGHWDAAAESLNQTWEQLANQQVPQGVQAQILDVQGQLQFARGDLEPALKTWQQTADLYAQLEDTQRNALSRLHQAQVLQAQGLFQQVSRTLTSLQTELANQPDSVLKADILRHLGDSLRATGDLNNADQVLQDSLSIAERLNDSELVAAATLSLGNLEQSWFTTDFERGNVEQATSRLRQALGYYQRLAAQPDSGLEVEAHLNLMRLLAHPLVGQWDMAIRFYPTVRQQLAQLDPGREAIYGYTGLAENLITLKQNSDRAEPSWADIIELLVPAQQQATALSDPRSQSIVLGTLGHVYEQNSQWADAETVSRQALALAQGIQADDIRYQWQWQLGRIFKAQGQNQQAISFYRDAFNTLKGIRSDLVSANADVQFSFRERVEPIYRELVDLLLSSVPTIQETAQARGKQHQTHNKQSQAYLTQAQAVMESLQVAELDNFFQAACIDETENINQVVAREDPTAAVLSAILLDDRLEVVMKLPGQADLVHYTSFASQQTIGKTLKDYHLALTNGENVQQFSTQVYDWLIRPAADQGLLSPETIKTLIFVLDGDLRLIPMANLFDGERFLIENYAISLILGQEVRKPQILPPRDQLDVLATSLEDPPVDLANLYGPLPNVNQELENIAATELPSSLLQDDAFTSQSLEQELNTTDYTIVHLATHGQFGSDRANTFILAADGTIDIDAFGQIFQSRRQADTRLEMLILSACKTATGNSREVLGIAGAAVQAGARSTIATLWSVDDDASVVFSDTLYDHLGQPGVSRAEALRQAQLELLKQYPGRPRFWAPYVLVGSWR